MYFKTLHDEKEKNNRLIKLPTRSPPGRPTNNSPNNSPNTSPQATNKQFTKQVFELFKSKSLNM